MSVLLEVHSPRYEEARDALSRFAELVKSPEHIHTYRITPLSIWNAAASGVDAERACRLLESLAKYEVPRHVLVQIRSYADRYGRLSIERSEVEGALLLSAAEEHLAEEISRRDEVAPLLGERISPTRFLLPALHRGRWDRVQQG